MQNSRNFDLHRKQVFTIDFLWSMGGRWVVDENSFDHRQESECHEVRRVGGRVVDFYDTACARVRVRDP